MREQPAAVRTSQPARRCALLLSAALAFVPVGAFAATTVYRSVDAQGNVVFSDQPPAPGQQAETVEIREPTSFQSNTPPAANDSNATWEWDMRAQDAADQAIAYGGIVIASPANDEGVRANDGTLTVVVGVDPELQPGHLVEILLDGGLAGSANATSVALTEIERGTHTLEARIVDASGTVLATSSPVTFHMLRYAPLLAPNRPRPAPHGG